MKNSPAGVQNPASIFSTQCEAVTAKCGETKVEPFTYDYQRTGGSGANLNITFPGAGSDRIDDYDMEFDPNCEGSYDRNSYKDGISSGSGGGDFTPGRAALLPSWLFPPKSSIPWPQF